MKDQPWAISVVSIVGLRIFEESYASGIISGASLATHCFAPAGDVVSSHLVGK